MEWGGQSGAKTQRGKAATKEEREWKIEDGRSRLQVCFCARTRNLAQSAQFTGIALWKWLIARIDDGEASDVVGQLEQGSASVLARVDTF